MNSTLAASSGSGGARVDETTWRPYEEVAPRAARALISTVLYHPEMARIGDVARLRGQGEDGVCALSRSEPEFHAADGRARGGLADRAISRTPLLLLPEAGGGLRLHGPGLAVAVEGRALTGPRSLSPRELEEGVLLQLAGRVLLWLQFEAEVERTALLQHDLIGESAAVHELRAEVLHVAGLGLPVLLRGESGTGKEQVARALHAASPRASRPYVALNLAALNPQTAVAELLGHRRGAFTGATRAHAGYFREADGGTIFLDEIGEAPLDVQAALLRVLETGEVQPVGGGNGRVDVRVIAATEVDLEAAVLAGSFRLSLLHRLAGYEIWLPPLRARRADIPRLLMHLIRAELLRSGGEQAERAFERDLLVRLPPSLMASLVRLDWAGNGLQLNNAARQIVALARAGRDPRSCASLARLLAPAGPEAPAEAPERPGRAATQDRSTRAAAPSPEALAAVLERNHWKIDVSARELGISKTSLYAQIARSPGLRTAGDISRAELLRCSERHGGDLKRMAEELRVSLRALQLRLRELRLPPASAGA